MLRALQAGGSRDVLLSAGTFIPPLPPNREAKPRSTTLIVALNNPKGFGPPPAPSKISTPKPSSAEQPKETSKTKKGQRRISDDTSTAAKVDDEDDDEVPEIVMDRMIKRIGVSLGIPLVLAVLTFPLFWYLKVKLKLDVPEWLPLLVSGTFFGSSALGITYGIVSTSWDPVRDGSLLGWKEAKANWPIFFSNLQGKPDRR